MALAASLAALILAPMPQLEKHHTQYRHDGCNTHRCDHRMDKKAHAKTRSRWWKLTVPYRDWLYSTRMCESGGDYTINTGNGFYGAYQFDRQSWWSAGGEGFANQAEPLEQDYRAVIWLKLTGRGSWPVCG